MLAKFLKRLATERRSRKSFASGLRRASIERLESRELMAADANLIAYRPVTNHINYARYAVSEAVETDPYRGPGIRINGDDDNQNGVADYSDASTAAGGDNDLVRVDVQGNGTSFAVSWNGPLALWTTPTKSAPILNGGLVNANQNLWLEYVSQIHSTGTSASLMLTVNDTISQTAATDQLVFHSFRSVVIAIGGRDQNPSNFGDSRLGTFTMGGTLYSQGYDVQLFSHEQVGDNGLGAAYDEVVSAVLKRNADDVAIYGYSWGGGATYNLTVALNANAALAPAGYRLAYTAYVDAFRRSSFLGLSAETRKPVATAFHDNFYQRKDWLLKGSSVFGAYNINVTNTTWGKNLSHTSIDDNATLQSLLVNNLMTRVIA